MTPTEYETLRIAWDARCATLDAARLQAAACRAARNHLSANVRDDAGRLSAGSRKLRASIDTKEAEADHARALAEHQWVSAVVDAVGDVGIDYLRDGCDVGGTKFSYAREDEWSASRS